MSRYCLAIIPSKESDENRRRSKSGDYEVSTQARCANIFMRSLINVKCTGAGAMICMTSSIVLYAKYMMSVPV